MKRPSESSSSARAILGAMLASMSMAASPDQAAATEDCRQCIEAMMMPPNSMPFDSAERLCYQESCPTPSTINKGGVGTLRPSRPPAPPQAPKEPRRPKEDLSPKKTAKKVGQPPRMSETPEELLEKLGEGEAEALERILKMGSNQRELALKLVEKMEKIEDKKGRNYLFLLLALLALSFGCREAGKILLLGRKNRKITRLYDRIEQVARELGYDLENPNDLERFLRTNLAMAQAVTDALSHKDPEVLRADFDVLKGKQDH